MGVPTARRRRMAATCLATSAAFGAPALTGAQQAQAEVFSPATFRHMSSLRFRTNRPGFGVFSDTGARVELYPGADNLLLKGCFIEGGLVTQLSPASVHPGGYVQAVPIAPLLLRASVQRLVFFGLFGAMVEYPDVKADWSPETLKDNQSEASFGGGWYAEGRATLRIKLGRFVAMHEQRLGWFRADLSEVGQGKAWYEPIFDLLVAQEDTMHTMKTTVGAVVSGELNAAFWLVAGHWERYQTDKSDQRRDIVGVVVMTRPVADWPGGATFGVLAGFMPDDTYRTGEPYIGGFWNMTFAGGDGAGPATP